MASKFFGLRKMKSVDSGYGSAQYSSPRGSQTSTRSRSSQGSHDAAILPTFPAGWYDDQRVMDTVTEGFLYKTFTAETQITRLQSVVMEGLTDMTYADWILEKTKKFFLLLLELGEANKIFDVVETLMWEDVDLPVMEEDLPKLRLRDSKLEERFMKRQFAFIIQNLEDDSHIDYSSDDIVPIEPVKTNFVGNSSGDEFFLPRANQTVIKKTIALGESFTRERFMKEVKDLKSYKHPHIISIFASYTYQDEGVILSTPATSFTLKTFFGAPSLFYKHMSLEGKRRQILDWMHCLSDAVTFLYENNIVHYDINPKTILIDGTNIVLTAADTSSSRPDRGPINQNYEYSAPEMHKRAPRLNFRKSIHHEPASRPTQVTDWIKSTDDDLKKCDVFSMGCTFLEMITFVLDPKKVKQFSLHRGAKNRRGGRGARAAIADQSFHANLEQVLSWMSALSAEYKEPIDENLIKAIEISKEMLYRDPQQRPEPRNIRSRIYTLAESECHGTFPHCAQLHAHKTHDIWKDFGFRDVLQSPGLIEFPISPVNLVSPSTNDNEFAWFNPHA